MEMTANHIAMIQHGKDLDLIMERSAMEGRVLW